MKGNELAYRRMMTALRLRQADKLDPARASLARNGLELARLLDGTLEPRDRVAAVRELRQLTDKLMETGPKPTGVSVIRGTDAVEDDDEWDTPSVG